jgi:hypothetical protein
LSEWDVTSVASRSTINGDCPVAAASGAFGPANAHARARAAARAELIALTAAGASLARASIVRETVGSEATRPNTPASARSTATSAKQSPPSARVIARSVRTFAGSWTANGLRHGANAADSSRPSPVAAIVSVKTTPPA